MTLTDEDLRAENERLREAGQFCARVAKADGQHEFVCAETVAIRAENGRLKAALKPFGAFFIRHGFNSLTLIWSTFTKVSEHREFT